MRRVGGLEGQSGSAERSLEILEPPTREESARVHQLTGGLGTSREWLPVDHNPLLGRAELDLPDMFCTIEPARLGGDLVRPFDPARDLSTRD